MYRITVEITGADGADPQGLKEKLAMEFERYGNVRIARVELVEPEQMRMEETKVT